MTRLTSILVARVSQNRPGHRCVLLFFLSLVTCHLSPSSVFAAQLPSLFRGVVVADSPLGVRVVSVEETSQAFLADLRPEDIVIRVEGTEIHSIDEFSTLSQALQGRVLSTTVLVFRNGVPRELALHLYSYPILRTWGLEFVPDHDLRFGQARVGLDYWRRLARGFDEAGQSAQALNAYLNGLHNVPDDLDTALKVAELSSRISQQHLGEGALAPSHQDRMTGLAEGIASLRDALLIMQKLFDYQLSEDQLRAIKLQLQETRRALHHAAEARSDL